MTSPPVREVRLRPEFAELYCGMVPDRWLLASLWAEAIVARAQEAQRRSVYRRTFDAPHFEFRGGEPARRERGEHLRTRSEDR